jgi:hypothetical protein
MGNSRPARPNICNSGGLRKGGDMEVKRNEVMETGMEKWRILDIYTTLSSLLIHLKVFKRVMLLLRFDDVHNDR